MKIEGSPQEIQVFINMFQDKNNAFNKQQLKQIEDLIKNTPVAGTTDVNIKLDSKEITSSLEKFQNC